MSAPTAGPEEIRQTGSREVYVNPWMRVREDGIVYPDGTSGVYGVVDKRDFALVLPFDGARFWLVSQYRYPVGRRYWEFPQGATTDDDPAVTAATELAEETGLRAGSLRELGRLAAAYGYSGQWYSVFLATDLVPGRQRLEPTEQGLVAQPFDPAEVVGLVRAGELVDAHSLAAWALLGLDGSLDGVLAGLPAGGPAGGSRPRTSA